MSRVSGEFPQTDSVVHAIDLISSDLFRGSHVLDVGCGLGHAWRSLRDLGVSCTDIGDSDRGLQLGRVILKDLDRNRLLRISVETLLSDQLFDIVMCLNSLHFLHMFHLPPEIMARVNRKQLVIRSCFGKETVVRFFPDVMLEPGVQSMRLYANV